MKKILLTLVLASASFICFSQQKVALESAGTTTIFGGSAPFADAYAAAVTGDIIYLPGATMPGFTLDKSITIIGTGFYPSATTATNPTKITGNITVNGNADNLHLEGIQFNGTITFGANQQVDNVTIKRCKMSGVTYNGTGATPCINNSIEECIITGNFLMSNLSHSILTNSIIEGYFSGGTNMGISNNLMLKSSSSYLLMSINNSLFSNNIFLIPYVGYFEGSCNLNTFSNNIFTVTPAAGNNIYTSNYPNTVIATLFVNQSGEIFDYAQDYHLVAPTTYLGTDGNQVGLYGGISAYKEEAIPHNPHIVSKTIASQTNAAGELPIQITVKAQNN